MLTSILLIYLKFYSRFFSIPVFLIAIVTACFKLYNTEKVFLSKGFGWLTTRVWINHTLARESSLKVTKLNKSQLKVAWSGFWVTIPFKFEKLVYHHKQSNGKSIATAVQEKVTITMYWRHTPFYIIPNYLSSRDNFAERSMDLWPAVLVLRSAKF